MREAMESPLIPPRLPDGVLRQTLPAEHALDQARLRNQGNMASIPDTDPIPIGGQ